MRRSITNRLRLLACGLLFVGSLFSSRFGFALESSADVNGVSESSADEKFYSVGLTNVPGEIRNLWLSLTPEPDLPSYSSHYAQAHAALIEIGRLVTSRDGYIPQKRDAEYAGYQNAIHSLTESLSLIADPIEADSYGSLAGLKHMPPFLADRWKEQLTYSDVLLYRALFHEGRFILENTETLIAPGSGKIPKSGDPGFQEYQSLKSDFTRILDEISYRSTRDQEGKLAGLEYLPEEMAYRWITLVNDEKAVSYREFLVEGESLIIHLGSFIESLQGKVPARGEAGYEVYNDILNRISRVLEGILMKYAFSLPTEAIDSTLSEYLQERGKLSQGMKAQREELLEGGLELLQSRQNDEIFLKYPHRRATIAGLYFRVAELVYEDAFDRFLEESDRYIDEMNRLSETNPDSVALLIQPKPDYFRVQTMFQRIVDEFPTSEFADDALYNIGLLKSEEGSQAEKDNANRIFETLISLYPDSDYKLNALRRIAEFYFNPPVNNIEKSVEVYTRIMREYPGSQYYQQALYKLGWAYYRMNEMDSAVEYFAKSLDENFRALKGLGGKASNVLDIAQESINYIGVCYSVEERDWEGAGIDNMVAWLNQYPDRKENYGRELLIQLGDIYKNQIGQYPNAVQAYHRYLEAFPNDPQSPVVQYLIVEMYQEGLIYDIPRALEEKKQYFATYTPDSEWWALNKDVKARNAVIPNLENYLNLILDEELVLATEKRDKKTFEEFVQYCRQYLRFWPAGPNAYKVQSNLATVLKNQLNQPTEALREFWQVATAYEDTARRETACNEVVIITNELVKQERDKKIYVTPDGSVLSPEMAPAVDEAVTAPAAAPETAPPAEAVPDTLKAGSEVGEEEDEDEQAAEPVKITPLLNSERLFLQGIDLYYYNYPEAMLASRVLYQAGDILFQHKMFPESRVYLRELISEFPDDRLVEDAYKLVIEGHFWSQEYAEVESVSKEIATSDLSKDLKSTVTRRKAQSLFLNAKDLKTGNNHYAAAKEFMRVAIETPDFEEADRSLFLAGNEFMLDKAWKEANEAFLLLVDKYPASERADKSLLNVAVNLQKELKDAAGSAKVYERLVNSYPKSPLVQNALANASANYNEVKDHRSAIRVNEQYVARFPGATDCDVYLFENAAHYLALDEVENANEIYMRFAQKYPNDPRTIQAYFERGSYFLKQKDQASAEREFRSTVEVHNKVAVGGNPGNPKFASKALAMLLDWETAEYDQLKYRLPEAQLTVAKERKKQWRNSLYDKYRKLIELGQKEGYKAFYQVGRLDEELALASFNQEMAPSKKLEDELAKVGDVVDESIILNAIAIATFRENIKNLQTIHTQLRQQQDSLNRTYQAYSEKVSQWQKDEIPGAADSLQKQSQLGRVVTEVDSAVIVAENWIQACRDRIPEIALRNGDYLRKLWALDLTLKSDDKNEEIRLLYRQEVLNSAVTPLAPEICGLYLQALQTAVEFGKQDAHRSAIERGVSATIDTLRAQYEDQCNKVTARIDRYIGHYENILPKGEDARTPDGLYADEMGIIIQDQLDYFNAFTLDWTRSFSAVMDSVNKYTLPPDFAGLSLDKGLQSVLNWHAKFLQYKSKGEAHKEEFAAKYSENGELQWDDASIAFEDMAAYASEYDRALLEEGLKVKNTYEISGPTGVQLMRTLVEFYPETYAAQFGLSAQHFTVPSALDWKIWHEETTGFEGLDFDDAEWKNPNYSSYPYGSMFGALDTLGARAIWYRQEMPVLDLPEEVTPVTEVPAEVVLLDTLSSDSLQIADGDSAVTAEPTLPVETEPQITGEDREALQQRYEQELAEWKLWCEPDSGGVRKYLFRKTFDIDSDPSAGMVWMTVDDDYSIYLNGVYIDADKSDTLDWMVVNEFEVGKYLHVGRNVLAIEAKDIDGTGYGLLCALRFENIPELSNQLQLVSSREAQRQENLRTDRSKAWQAHLGSALQETYQRIESETPVSPVPEPTLSPSEDEIQRFLTEKKKLY